MLLATQHLLSAVDSWVSRLTEVRNNDTGNTDVSSFYSDAKSLGSFLVPPRKQFNVRMPSFPVDPTPGKSLASPAGVAQRISYGLSATERPGRLCRSPARFCSLKLPGSPDPPRVCGLTALSLGAGTPWSMTTPHRNTTSGQLKLYPRPDHTTRTENSLPHCLTAPV